jgi:hypothetical protein
MPSTPLHDYAERVITDRDALLEMLSAAYIEFTDIPPADAALVTEHNWTDGGLVITSYFISKSEAEARGYIKKGD